MTGGHEPAPCEAVARRRIGRGRAARGKGSLTLLDGLGQACHRSCRLAGVEGVAGLWQSQLSEPLGVAADHEVPESHAARRRKGTALSDKVR